MKQVKGQTTRMQPSPLQNNIVSTLQGKDWFRWKTRTFHHIHRSDRARYANRHNLPHHNLATIVPLAFNPSTRSFRKGTRLLTELIRSSMGGRSEWPPSDHNISFRAAVIELMLIDVTALSLISIDVLLFTVCLVLAKLC